MILTDTDILKGIQAGHIQISGFDPERLGSNSYDLTLGEDLATYKLQTDDHNENLEVLDCAKAPYVHREKIHPNRGYLLMPGILYLGVTRESTRTTKHVPLVEGKSSIGRLGLTVHVTAGVGDVGFEGHWTLEMTVVHPLRVYADMPVCQLLLFETLGTCRTPYSLKKSAKYAKQPGVPMPSMMWKNFLPKEALL